MNCVDEHGRCLAYIFWIFSIGFMIAAIICQFDNLEHGKMAKIPDSLCFFTLANAAPLFRVFGVNWFIHLLHVVLTIATYVVVSLKFSDFPIWIIIPLYVLLTLQVLLTLLIIVCRPGWTAQKRAVHVGIHALIGIITIFAYFLLCCFLVKPNNMFVSCIVEMVYMLLLLMILLTPPCLEPRQAVPRAEQERKQLLQNIYAREGRGRSADTCICTGRQEGYKAPPKVSIAATKRPVQEPAPSHRLMKKDDKNEKKNEKRDSQAKMRAKMDLFKTK